jgi:hypothetical protein
MPENQYDNFYPEIYYDIIARLIPGFSVVVFYSSLPNDWQFFVKMIPIAYLIGIVLDITSNLIIQVPFDHFLKRYNQTTVTQLWHSLARVTPKNIRIAKKKLAEIVFFRSALGYVVLQFIGSLITGQKPVKLADLSHFYLALLMAGIFIFSCYWRTIWLLSDDNILKQELS